MKNKILLTIFTLYVSTLVFSQKYEKQLIGNWQLKEYKAINIKEYSEYLLGQQKHNIDLQIDNIMDRKQNVRDTNTLNIYYSQILKLQKQKDTMTIDWITNSLETQLAEYENTYEITFYDDKTYKSSNNDLANNWYIDKKTIVVMAGKSKTNWKIIKLKQNQLIAKQEYGEKIIVKMKMVFEKKI